MSESVIRFSSTCFPSSGDVKDESGLPLGCVVTPLLNFSVPDGKRPFANDIARCDNCGAYINVHCQVIVHGTWMCVLCRGENTLGPRYHKVSRNALAELVFETCEFNMLPEDTASQQKDNNDDDDDNVGHGSGDQDGQQPRQRGRHLTNTDVMERPVFIALVDLGGSDNFMEVVKSSIVSALKVVPQTSLFGLITFTNDHMTLWNLRPGDRQVCGFGRCIAISSLMTPTPDGLPHLLLSDVSTLPELLVPIDEFEDSISTAIENLVPHRSDGSCYGVAVHAIVDLLEEHSAAMENTEFCYVRVMSFLASRPSVGVGVCSAQRLTASHDTSSSASSSATTPMPSPFVPEHNFYEVQAKRCRELGGVVFDVYVVSSRFVDLVTFQPLAHVTGGAVGLYEDTEAIPLPQDLVKQLDCNQFVTQVMLRIRTCPELGVSQSVGVLASDATYDGLFRLPGLHASNCFAFDLHHASSDSFEVSFPEATPVIQMACAFTHFDKSGKMTRYLRVHTAAAEVATSAAKVFTSVNTDVVLTLLVRKAIKTSLTSGPQITREMVFEWLCRFVVRVFQYGQAQKPTDILSNETLVDKVVGPFRLLRNIPRLAWALIRHRLLLAGTVHPDERAYAFSLLRTLGAKDTSALIHPQLDAYATITESPIRTGMPLRHSVLAESSGHVFVMDCVTHLIVLYAHSAAELPFPPPQDSPIRTSINYLKQHRCVTPRVVFCREGSGDARQFSSLLIDDPHADTKSSGYSTFLSRVADEIQPALKKHLESA